MASSNATSPPPTTAAVLPGQNRKVREAPDTEWIEDGVRYIASEAYGLETGKEFLLYSPETPTEGLDEEFLTWWPSWNVEDTGTLNCWGLLNQEMGYGFFTYS